MILLALGLEHSPLNWLLKHEPVNQFSCVPTVEVAGCLDSTHSKSCDVECLAVELQLHLSSHFFY